MFLQANETLTCYTQSWLGGSGEDSNTTEMQIEKMDYEVSDRHRDSIKTELRPFVLYSGVDSDYS